MLILMIYIFYLINLKFRLIIIYNIYKWDENRIQKYENEKYLRNCPLCRK